MYYNMPGMLNPTAAEFPAAGTIEERWRYLLSFAIQAPSAHNVQPWRFAIVADEVELYADRSRSLPVVDPQGRELTISCGAALFCLRMALRHAGFMGDIRCFPNPENLDLLARIGFGAAVPATSGEEQLYASIPNRHTYRLPFSEHAIAEEVLTEIKREAEEQGAWVRFLREGPAREALIALIGEADREQLSDPRFRRELASWMHSNESAHHDGLPGRALGLPGPLSHVGPFLIRTFDTGVLMAAHDRQLAVNAPMLCVVGTAQDIPQEWLRAGQTLACLLLRATSHEINASFLNAPLELPPLRARVAAELALDGCPQLILRLGYGHEIPPTPRRTVDEVLIIPKLPLP